MNAESAPELPGDRKIQRPPRILVVVAGTSVGQPMGPQIRGFEIARRLATEFEVTVATHSTAPADLGGVRVVPAGRLRLLLEAVRCEAVVAPWLPPFLLPVLATLGVLIVPDLFDPVELELAEGERWELESAKRLTRLQLAFADLLVCGGRRQRERLLAALRRSRRRREPPVAVVPFGIHGPPGRTSGHPLREGFGLSAEDVVVLWWGSLWRWFDPETAIRAFSELRKRRPEAHLVFSAGRAPDPALGRFEKTADAMRLAAELGLLGAGVHFLDAWVPYGERHLFLGDADIGLCLHADQEEAAHAVRARYFDFLWCGLPVVLSGGDELAAELVEAGLAVSVPRADVTATATALERLVADRSLREAGARAGKACAERYRWPHVVRPLAEQLGQQLSGSRRPRPGAACRALAAAASYYARAVGQLRLRHRAQHLTPALWADGAHSSAPAEGGEERGRPLRSSEG